MARLLLLFHGEGEFFGIAITCFVRLIAMFCQESRDQHI